MIQQLHLLLLRRRHNRSSSKSIHLQLLRHIRLIKLVTLLLLFLALLQIKFSSRCYDYNNWYATRIHLIDAFHTTTSKRRSSSKLSTPIISWRNVPFLYTNNQREIQSNVVVRYQLQRNNNINNNNTNHPKTINTQQQDTTTMNRNNNTTKESSIVTIGIRLNKVFTKIYSRRATDTLIANGRIKVNNVIVTDLGRRVIPYQDIITLDNEIYTNWEQHINIDTPTLTISNASISTNTSSGSTSQVVEEQTTSLFASTSIHENFQNEHHHQQQQQHIYIKYWKPVGVISTTDRNIPNNLLDSIYSTRNSNINRNDSNQNLNRQMSLQNTRRIFNVGRLDKDSSGLLLLTSDGRIPNVVLSKQFVHTKVYYVVIDRPITYDHIQQLRQGIVITTDTIRQKKHFSYTAKTLPCKIEPLYHNNGTIQSNRITESNYIPTRKLHITLIEGRNRQIRVMLQTIGMYHVQILHRIQFMSTIDLYNLHQPGDWTYLNQTELHSLQQAIVHSKQTNKSIN